MLHDGRERDGKRARQLADSDGFLGVEAGQQGPSGRVGEGGEGAVEGGGFIVNHRVNN